MSNGFFNLSALKKNMSCMHIHTSMQEFTLYLIRVFIPVYLFIITNSVTRVFEYYIYYFLAFIVGALLTSKLSFIGFKKIMFLRPISLIVYFAWLYSVEFFPSSFVFLALYNGLITTPYWISFHYFFTKKADFNNIDRQVGLLFSLPKIFTLLAPVIGAFIISYFSFKVLFVIVSLLLFVSLIPLINLKDYRISYNFNINNLFDKKFTKYGFGFIAEGLNYIIVYVLLPFFIFLTFNQTYEAGFYASLLELSGFLTPLIISRLAKGKSSFYIKTGAVSQGLLFFLIFLLNTPLEFFFFGFIIGTFTTIWRVPFYTRIYKHAKRSDNALEFLIFRSLIFGSFRLLVFVILLLTGDFTVPFLIEAVSKLLLLAF